MMCVTVHMLVQGTRSSRRKKQAKIKRVMATVKKAEKREAGKGGAFQQETFAALHLLHDPQVRLGMPRVLVTLY